MWITVTVPVNVKRFQWVRMLKTNIVITLVISFRVNGHVIISLFVLILIHFSFEFFGSWVDTSNNRQNLIVKLITFLLSLLLMLTAWHTDLVEFLLVNCNWFEVKSLLLQSLRHFWIKFTRLYFILFIVERICTEGLFDFFISRTKFF